MVQDIFNFLLEDIHVPDVVIWCAYGNPVFKMCGAKTITGISDCHNQKLVTCCQFSSSVGCAGKQPVSKISWSSLKMVPLGNISILKADSQVTTIEDKQAHHSTITKLKRTYSCNENSIYIQICLQTCTKQMSRNKYNHKCIHSIYPSIQNSTKTSS